MVEAATAVVVGGGVTCGDVEGDVEAAGDLVEDLVLEFLVSRCWLFGLELTQLPSGWKRRHHPLGDFKVLERLACGDVLGVRWHLGVEHGGEVGGCFRCREDSQGVTAELGEKV